MSDAREKGIAERHYDAVASAHRYLLQNHFVATGASYTKDDAGEFSMMAAVAYLAIKEIQDKEWYEEQSRREATKRVEEEEGNGVRQAGESS